MKLLIVAAVLALTVAERTYEAPREAPRNSYSAPDTRSVVVDPIAILRQSAELRDDHSYDMQFETENGILASESGRALPAEGYGEEGSFEVAGEYSYTGDDGKLYKLVYVADENGFQAQGDHLPTPVPTQYPTPDPSDDGDDGSYRAEVRNSYEAPEVKTSYQEPEVRYQEPAAPVRTYNGYPQ